MEAWNKFLLQQEDELGVETVRKWLRTLKVIRFDARNLFLQAKDPFQILWFEEHIQKKIKTSLLNNNKQRIRVHISLDKDPTQTKPKTDRKKSFKEKLPQTEAILHQFAIEFDPLDALCTMEAYIPPLANPLCYKVLLQLTEKKNYRKAEFNPIYIYGALGSGKSHLLMAVAHSIKKKNGIAAYVRAETFTDHVVTAIRSSEMSRFRQSYRNVDVLIIDDVHLLANKWATQEELFHTFNALHVAEKQIILGSTCLPSELQSIEPRLISRFEWGVVLPVVPLQRDELEKMLRVKALGMGYPIGDRTVDFLLTTFTSSAATLCRALDTLILRMHLQAGRSEITPTQLTISMMQHHLGDLIEEEKKQALTPEKIIEQVANSFGIRLEDILGKAQSRDCVLPRQIAMYLCRTQLQMPYTKIGALFNKDHSTVMSNVKLMQEGVNQQKTQIVDSIQTILQKLRSHV